MDQSYYQLGFNEGQSILQTYAELGFHSVEECRQHNSRVIQEEIAHAEEEMNKAVTVEKRQFWLNHLHYCFGVQQGLCLCHRRNHAS